MNHTLNANLESILSLSISDERKSLLQELIDYIKSKREKGQPIRLNFICTLERSGFIISKHGHSNPIYFILQDKDTRPIIVFSKLYDDVINPHGIFATIMTCSHADENCPFIPGAEARIPVRYEDPKEFDDTDVESTKYDERSQQIASEMFYVFSRV